MPESGWEEGDRRERGKEERKEGRKEKEKEKEKERKRGKKRFQFVRVFKTQIYTPFEFSSLNFVFS